MHRGTPVADMIGKAFGYLTVLQREGSYRTGAAWRCRCTCGAEVVVAGMKLRQGRTKACCVSGHRWQKSQPPGLTVVYKLEHRSWRHMWWRCTSKDPKHVRNYSARGITICDRWKSFKNFLEDMGKKPTSKHSIDRHPNNDGNYEPTNCRWATAKQQSENRRTTLYVEYRGERMRLTDVVSTLGIATSNIRTRIRLGWSLEDALTIPVKRYAKKRGKKCST